MGVDNFSCDKQTQTKTRKSITRLQVGAVEVIEHFRHFFLRDANAPVHYLDVETGFIKFSSEIYVRTWGAEF